MSSIIYILNSILQFRRCLGLFNSFRSDDNFHTSSQYPSTPYTLANNDYYTSSYTSIPVDHSVIIQSTTSNSSTNAALVETNTSIQSLTSSPIQIQSPSFEGLVLGSTEKPIIDNVPENSSLVSNPSDFYLLLTLFVNQTPTVVRNITMEGMFSIDEINIINVNNKTIMVTTDEDMANFPFSNISNINIQNPLSSDELINDLDSIDENFEGNVDSFITTATPKNYHETTRPSEDSNLLNENGSTILPISIPVTNNDNKQPTNNSFLPLVFQNDLNLNCNRILDTLKVITKALVNLFQIQQ